MSMSHLLLDMKMDDDSEEEDEELMKIEREKERKRKNEAIRAKKEENERKRKQKEEEFQKNCKVFKQLTFVQHMENERVNIGDENESDYFREMIPLIDQLYCGKPEKLEELHDISSFQNMIAFINKCHVEIVKLRRDEEEIKIHDFCLKYAKQCIRSLVRCSAVDIKELNNVQKFDAIYSTAFDIAHSALLKPSEHKFKNIQFEFMRLRQEEEKRVKEEIEENSKTFALEVLELEEGDATDQLIDDFNRIQIGSSVRDTSPGRYRARFTQETLDSLIDNFADMFVAADDHGELSIKNESSDEEDLNEYDESDVESEPEVTEVRVTKESGSLFGIFFPNKLESSSGSESEDNDDIQIIEPNVRGECPMDISDDDYDAPGPSPPVRASVDNEPVAVVYQGPSSRMTINEHQIPPMTRVGEKTPNRGIEKERTPTRTISRQHTPDRRMSRENSPMRSVDRGRTPTRTYSREHTPRRTVSRENTPRRSYSRDNTPSRSYAKELTPRRTISREHSPSRTYSREHTPRRSYSREHSPSRTFTKELTPRRTMSRENTPSRLLHRDKTPTRTIEVYPDTIRVTIENGAEKFDGYDEEMPADIPAPIIELQEEGVDVKPCLEHLGMLARKKKKKSVRFVEFFDEKNTMRLYCTSMNWFLNNWDDGTTIATKDMQLREGYKYIRRIAKIERPLITPVRPMPDRPFQRDINEKVQKLTKNVADDLLDFNYKGSLLGHFYYPLEEFVGLQYPGSIFYYGLLESYMRSELMTMFAYHMSQIVVPFAKGYARAIVPRNKDALAEMNGCIKDAVRQYRVKYGVKNKYEVINMLRQEERKVAKVSSVLIFTDWRLIHLDNNNILNAEIIHLPTHIGSVLFASLAVFLKQLLSKDTIEMKHIVFAFGGHESMEIQQVLDFLIWLLSFLESKKLGIKVHWYSCRWSDSMYTKNGYVELGEMEEKFNLSMDHIIREWSEEAKKNMNYHLISYPPPNNPDQLAYKTYDTRILDNLYNVYIRRFIADCGLIVNSRCFQVIRRNYYLYNSEDFTKPFLYAP